jgi:hypothetical protein
MYYFTINIYKVREEKKEQKTKDYISGDII